MGVLSIIAEITILVIEIGGIILAINYYGVGPALEPPAHLGIFGRVAYYTFHHRFRDFFVPLCALGFIHEGFRILKGDVPGRLWLHNLFILWGTWLWALTITRMEAIRFSSQPYNEDEEKLWTEGMTRREFLKRKRGRGDRIQSVYANHKGMELTETSRQMCSTRLLYEEPNHSRIHGQRDAGNC
ncbi:hypothetical protein F5Y03DRAFT_368269 [Xylaria venustula]|nr:hypothetical protein F5Y03DRAFT_368269 [Xylaria venustula]